MQTAAPRRHYRLVVAYDGTDFSGWQVQPGLPTVQGTLAEAIRKVAGESVLPQGSGRTDAGVHAEGQTVSLDLAADIPAIRLARALNQRLPSSIRVVSAEDASAEFHARSGVLHKTYEYRIFTRQLPGEQADCVCPPWEARYAWDCRWPLELEAMQQAAAALEGTHDFTSFAASDPDRTQRQAAENLPVHNIRSIYGSAWARRGRLLVYRVTGSGFLHHMVRNIVGTCVEIGRGQLGSGSVPSILQARERRSAGPTAPPQGLHLMRVMYAANTDVEAQPEPGSTGA